MSASELRLIAHRNRERYLELLARLVRIETPSRDLEGAAAFVEHLEEVLTSMGWRAERQPRDGVGDVLVARLGEERDGPATLLLCHYDTVHPRGSFGPQTWRVEGDVARGPGVVDMKAGIAGAVLAPELLDEIGAAPIGPLTLLVSSDEEIGSAASRELIEAEAAAHARVFVLEPSRDDGALKAGRKGVGGYRIRLRGRASHAGLAPHDGASALVELAHLVLEVAGLGDDELGTTVTPTVARAGTATNVVAEEAELSVDVRFLETAEAQRVDEALRSYAPRDARVSPEVSGGLGRPPMEPNEANRRLLSLAQRLAAEAGWEAEGAVVGGGSDGNFTSALGVPTLDGLGSVGGGAHTRDEHVRVGETLDRLALLAALLMSPSTSVRHGQ